MVPLVTNISLFTCLLVFVSQMANEGVIDRMSARKLSGVYLCQDGFKEVLNHSCKSVSYGFLEESKGNGWS